MTRSARAMRDDPSALMRDGEALLVAGDLGRAARSFRRAISLAPRFGEAYLGLSDTLIDERPEEAVAVLRHATALDSRAWLMLGMAQFDASAFDAGRLSEAAPAAPGDRARADQRDGLLAAGDVHDTLGERRPALRALRAALQLAPTHVPACLVARAWRYERTARGVRSRARATVALRLAPRTPRRCTTSPRSTSRRASRARRRRLRARRRGARRAAQRAGPRREPAAPLPPRRGGGGVRCGRPPRAEVGARAGARAPDGHGRDKARRRCRPRRRRPQPTRTRPSTC